MLNITDEIGLRKKFCVADYLKHLSENSPDYSSTIGTSNARNIVKLHDISLINLRDKKVNIFMNNVFHV